MSEKSSDEEFQADTVPETEPCESENDFEGEVLRITITNNDAESKTYYAHKGLLQAKSPYFAALTNFREGAESLVMLNKTDHDVFRQVLYWMYKNVFRKDTLYNIPTMIKTWAAADSLLMEECRNLAMDKLRSFHKTSWVAVWDIAILLDLGYSNDSTISNHLIDQFSFNSIIKNQWMHYVDDVRDLCEVKSDLALVFMNGLAIAGAKWRNCEGGEKPENLAETEGCVYHDHLGGQSCDPPKPIIPAEIKP